MVAECVGNAGTSAVIAAGEAWRRLIVPVTVERYVPLKIAPELDVVSDVKVGMDAARVGKCWQNSRGEREVRLVEAEKSHLTDDRAAVTCWLVARKTCC